MRKYFWFAQFFVASSLAGLLLSGCGNVSAQEEQWKPGLGATLFDLAPKESDGPETTYKSYKDAWDCGYSKTPSACEKVPVHHVACEDKSRFLLQSEDGKWHCLKLTP